MSLHLRDVTTYIPQTRASLESLMPRLGLNRYQAQILSRFHGLHQVPMAEGLGLKDLLKQPLERLLTSPAVRREKIQALVYCHTIQTVAPFPLSPLNELRDELGLQSADTFSLTMQNCASSVTALDVIDSILRNSPDGDAQAILLTGEKAFTPTVQLIPGTTIMGEASAAALFSRRGPGSRVLSVRQKVVGQFSTGVRLDPDSMREFELLYVPTLVQTMNEALELAHTGWEEVRLVVPHNINLSSWRRVAEALGLPIERIYLAHLSELGHCFCSDIFLNYRSALESAMLRPRDKFLMVSVGLGATFGAAVIEQGEG